MLYTPLRIRANHCYHTSMPIKTLESASHRTFLSSPSQASQLELFERTNSFSCVSPKSCRQEPRSGSLLFHFSINFITLLLHFQKHNSEIALVIIGKTKNPRSLHSCISWRQTISPNLKNCLPTQGQHHALSFYKALSTEEGWTYPRWLEQPMVSLIRSSQLVMDIIISS